MCASLLNVLQWLKLASRAMQCLFIIWHTSTENGWRDTKAHTKPNILTLQLANHRRKTLTTTKRSRHRIVFFSVHICEMRFNPKKTRKTRIIICIIRPHQQQQQQQQPSNEHNIRCNYTAKETKHSCQIFVHQTCLSTFVRASNVAHRMNDAYVWNNFSV